MLMLLAVLLARALVVVEIGVMMRLRCGTPPDPRHDPCHCLQRLLHPVIASSAVSTVIFGIVVSRLRAAERAVQEHLAWGGMWAFLVVVVVVVAGGGVPSQPTSQHADPPPQIRARLIATG